jgi:tagatose-1,6-bisphosphate aldolase
VVCVLALDHRDAMRNAFRRIGIEDVSAATMGETKARIIEAVAASASGALLDHDAARRRPPGLGVLVPLEKQGYTTLDGGRLTELEFSAKDRRGARLQAPRPLPRRPPRKRGEAA